MAVSGSGQRHSSAYPRPDGLSATIRQSDANRSAINALGVQTADRFDRLEQRIDGLEHGVYSGFADMRGRLDQTAAGMQQIVDLLSRDEH